MKKTENSLDGCPEWVVGKAVQVLKDHLCKHEVETIQMLYKYCPETWWHEDHRGWGLHIRNLLRREVCSDKEFSFDRSWDDFYVILIEIACGLKTYGGCDPSGKCSLGMDFRED
jgi:hypothetical protein